MNDPRTNKPDTAPSPDRDTSRKGREEEVINQQEEDKVTNADSNKVVNRDSANKDNTGEQQFREGMADNSVKLDEADQENPESAGGTGREESAVPGSGV